jgi:prepilin-type N-terminal cleavage/methylation domain-containing protein
MRRVHPSPGRAGMTLIELLIVMLIIATLASLILAAVFAVRSSQEKNFTEALVQKIDTALAQQWKAATDQIREEPVPNWALTMANGDPRIAKVIYLKARLKQEFPVSFFQATNPGANSQPGQGAFQTPGVFANPPQIDLPAKDAYRRAIPAALFPGYNIQSNAPYLYPVPSPIPRPDLDLPQPQPIGFESSALLYIAVSQGRRGLAGFVPEEHIEPTAIRTATVGGATFKYFVDSWGYPVRYWAFPYGNDELNASPYRDAFSQNQQSPDPQDPEQALLTLPTAAAYMWTTRFALMVHPTQPLRTLIPVVGSPGRDGAWGVDYFLMSPAAPTSDADDNIYSYRLRRVGRRGD